MRNIPGTKSGYQEKLKQVCGMATFVVFLSSPAFGEMTVTWDAPAPDFNTELVKHANSSTVSVEARELSNNRSPAQGITVEETFVLDAIYIEVGDWQQFDTEFQIVLAPAIYDSESDTLSADPLDNLIPDAIARTPLSTNDSGENVWVKFDVENITLSASANPYALFLTSSSTEIALLINRSAGNYLELGQNRYFEQRDSRPRLLAPSNGAADLRFALIAAPEPPLTFP